MTPPKIVVFSCQWSPHYAFQSLYRRGRRGEGDSVRVLTACVGRVGEDLVLEAFHQGADGVAVFGCPPEMCRHGLDHERFTARLLTLRGILETLGIPAHHLLVGTFQPHEAERLAGEIERFAAGIAVTREPETVNAATAAHLPASDAAAALRRDLSDLARSHSLRRCYDCGKCTSVCPVNIGGRPYSPRLLGQTALQEPGPALQSALWDCLTCGACREICPVGVDFPGFVRDARALLPGDAVARECSHGGALQRIQRLSADPQRRQDRLRWIPTGAVWAREGETLLFTGSAPYYDRYFDYLGSAATAAPLAALRIMNRLDITPVLLEQERSSGHDLLFAGDWQGFTRLARLNAAAMRAAGVRRVVTTCAESYHVMAFHYRNAVPGFSVDIEHFSTFLERELAGRETEFTAVPGRVTYHDPCRLGRMSGIIDAPRRLLARIPGLELAEMRHWGTKALCCGTSAWVRCGATNKAIQLERLGEAAATGSAMLATACPKCVIHLRCAQADLPAGPGKSLALADITEILAKSLAPPDATP